MGELSKVKGIITTTIILTIILIVLVSAYNIATANQDLKRIAFEETKNLDNDKNKAVALAKWISSNLKAESGEKVPELVFITGKGDCLGLSNVFVLMANSIGLPSRIVGTRGERHYWVEFFSDGQWLNIDPFTDNNGNSIGNLHYYDNWDSPFGKRFSYVYYETGDGHEQELTRKYTETGRLIVKTAEGSLPVSLRILVKSHHLIELDPNHYKSPDISFYEITNGSGILDKDLGGNNYTVVAEKDLLPILPPIIVLKSQKEIHLDKNGVVTVTFDLNNGFGFGFSELAQENILVICIYLAIICAGFLMYHYVKIALLKLKGRK